MSALIQGSEEWLQLRKSKIGASDAPVIMNASPWKTPYQLWLEKVSIGMCQKKTQAMQRGLDLEDKARQRFEEMTGVFMLPQVVFHPQFEWMIASLDGMDIDQKHIVEIKCPNKTDHETALSGKIPDKYYPQLQHQLEVCALDMAYYFSFDGENGKIIEVHRNEKYITALVEKEREFFECMQNFIAPETCHRDYNHKNDEFTGYLAAKLLEAKEKIKALQKEEKEMTDDLILRCDNQNTIGNGFKITKSIRKGSVDYSSISELKGIDLDKYRKQSIEVWRVSNG